MCNLGIEKSTYFKRTQRGKRAGIHRSKFRYSKPVGKSNIPVISSVNRTPTNQSASRARYLTDIPINRWQLPSLLNANVRSINNKVDELSVLVRDQQLDLVCLTESWLNASLPDIDIAGYKCVRRDRCNGKRGGGVICLINEHIPYKRWLEHECDEFESIWITIRPHKLPRCFPQIIFLSPT